MVSYCREEWSVCTKKIDRGDMSANDEELRQLAPARDSSVHADSWCGRNKRLVFARHVSLVRECSTMCPRPESDGIVPG